MIRRPPRSTRTDNSFPTRRSSDLIVSDACFRSARDIVLVHYEGRLTDGTVFDSSYQRRQPAAFPLRGLIPGWTEGIQLMPTGSKYRFWIPPELGSGAEGAGDGIITPHPLLSSDVALTEIAPTTGEDARPGQRPTALPFSPAATPGGDGGRPPFLDHP